MARAVGGKVKTIAIVASLAALALILSPAFSALQSPSTANAKGAGSLLQDTTFIKDDTVVQNVSDEDLSSCGSVNESIDDILGVNNNTKAGDRKVASDTLIAEFCNRPTLIHEIMSSDYHSMSLIAYACDASSGKIGTAAIQDSLSDHRQLYCDSARQLILNESNTFLATVEQFRTEYLPLLSGEYQNEFQPNGEDGEALDESGFDNANYTSDDEASINSDDYNFTNPAEEETGNPNSGVNTTAGQEEASPSSFNATNAEAVLSKVTESLNKSIQLVNDGEYYQASESFDNASKMFIAQFKDM